jgi:protoheme IX farnesyltransferase
VTKDIKNSLIKPYIALTKPGIIRGNLLTASAGFCLAAKGSIDYGLFVAMLVGTSLIIASACVFNNYIDRDIDAIMARTKQRGLVNGSVQPRSALIFATIVGLLGVAVLATYTNLLTLGAGVFGFIMYVQVYGLWKRRSLYGTHVGSISGAIPPLAGYVAVTNRIDTAAILLFVILVFWQMPHFFAIALYRKEEYAEANVPVLPVVRGSKITKKQILWFIIAYGASSLMLTVAGYTGITYALIMTLVTVSWLWLGLKGFIARHDAAWGKGMFLFSLIAISVQSVLLIINNLIP